MHGLKVLTLVSLGLLSSPSMGGASAQDPSHWLSEVRCFEQVDKILSSGRRAATGEWTTLPSRSQDGSQSILSPTIIPGLWVKVTKFLNNEVEIRRISAKFTSIYVFDVHRNQPAKDTCKVHKKGRKTQQNLSKEEMKAAFSDHDIVKLLESGKSGVIYVWSPGMPMSFDQRVEAQNANGLKNIATALELLQKGNHLSFDLVVAVDPTAARTSVSEIIATQPHMNASMGRPVHALDLIFRNSNQHYPAILVFHKGLITRHIYPGVETPERYRDYILEKTRELDQRLENLNR